MLCARASAIRSAARHAAVSRNNALHQHSVRLAASAATASNNRLHRAVDPFKPLDTLIRRHIGPTEREVEEMAKVCGFENSDALLAADVPKNIRRRLPGSPANQAAQAAGEATPLGRDVYAPLEIGEARGEYEFLTSLKQTASKNGHQFRSFIGMGYSGTITPPVILRNLLENPGWYTSYTPYQAEIAQGRLESLLNWQTMVADLTGMDVANASLLDEATAAAEAMNMAFQKYKKKRTLFIVPEDAVFPQTIEVVEGRAELIGVEVLRVSGDGSEWFAANADRAKDVCGVLLQYPAQDGLIADPRPVIETAKAAGALVIVATDLLACTLIKPPGELGADIVLGNSQRFGVPMGCGGPHAAFFAVRDDLKRIMPGRLIGLSKDRYGNKAIRMSLQTREQHIRRETATSNVCTAQALLANVAAMYAVYHGPQGLRDIAAQVHAKSNVLASGLVKVLHHGDTAHGSVRTKAHFDTVRVDGIADVDAVTKALRRRQINVRKLSRSSITISLDETTSSNDIMELWEGFGEAHGINFVDFTPEEVQEEIKAAAAAFSKPRTPGAESIPSELVRESSFLTHPVFSSYQTETDMLRYLKHLENKDYSLAHGMIPLGSCTMKLNATVEMIPITWPEFANIHPFAPPDQLAGYADMIRVVERTLADITGFHAVTLQSNAGSQGEYLGLKVIRAYLADRGEGYRNVCVLPASAHGTNPASAAMAGMKIVPVDSDADGNVDISHLRKVCEQHKESLAAFMITYPSTHGVFEDDIKEICDIVHANGGQVYMDGANMNSQVGYTSPGACGADVCHLNLHKTFCIPHGGGGPGLGPIGVAKHLTPFLPRHPVVDVARVMGAGLSDGPREDAEQSAVGTDERAVKAICAAPFSSALIIPISHAYIQLMGTQGLVDATKTAIVSANYMMARLKGHFDVRFKNARGVVAHEFIIDCSKFKREGVIVEDVAKRLMDYGFHAPTMSFPVAETLMIEPTESEPKAELDRLCDALIQIREEIRMVQRGEFDKEDNPLKNAPHTAAEVCGNEWNHKYSREQAAFPTSFVREHKFWPTVGRIDNVYGDRNLVCSCPPLEFYTEDQ